MEISVVGYCYEVTIFQWIKMHIRCLLNVLLFCCTCLVTLQAVAKINNVVLERLAVEDGLTQASVRSLAQDNNGYIWLGTDNGIDIFDGYKFTQLVGPDDDFFRHSIANIYTDSNGLLWLSIIGKGVYTYDLENNQYNLIIAHDADNDESYVWQVIQDADQDYFWLLTGNSIVRYHLPSKTVAARFLFDQSFGDNAQIYKVSVVNELLLVNTRAGLYVFDWQNNQAKKLPAIKQVDIPEIQFTDTESAKVYDSLFHDGVFYVGTNDGVFSFTETNLAQFIAGNSQEILYQNSVANVSVWQLITHNNQLYIATTKGLYRFNINEQRSEFLFDFSDNFKSVANLNITSMMVDKGGRIWLASQTSGAYIWDPKTENVITYTYKRDDNNSLSSSNILSMLFDEQQQLWVATADGLNLVNLEQNTVARFLEEPESNTEFIQGNIHDIKKDAFGHLWLATAIGVFIFDPIEKVIIEPRFPEATKQLLGKKNSWVTIENIGEYVWLVAEDGIYKIHALTGEMKHLTQLPNEFNSKFIWNVMSSFSGDDNEVLFSSSSTLWLYNDITNKLTNIYQQPNISKDASSYVDNWTQDENGLLWLSFTQVGLIALTPDTYQVKHLINEQNSMLDLNIYGVQSDEVGNLWVSSHDGIYRIRLDDLHVRKFSISDGLANSEFNSGAYTKLMDGRLAYGGTKGVSIFDPKVLSNKNQQATTKVSIVNISTLSRPLERLHLVPDNYKLTLAHDDFGIRIDFTDFSFGKNGETEYQYGFVNGVSFPPTKQSYVTFPRLDSGKYIFSVQAKSAITGELSSPALVYINVKYALWRSPFMIIIYITVILLAGFIWLRARQHRQKELLAAHEQVKYRENRLQLALSGSNSEVWDWKSEHDVIYGKRIADDLGYKDQDLATEFQQHVALIHPDDRDSFKESWQNFIRSADEGANFKCTYRLKSFDGRWLWYRDLGKIVAFDHEGKPQRVTGSYTNITESKIDQERAQYYGAAFEQTRDWVLIVDEKLEVGRANKSMSDIFSWQAEELDLTQNVAGIDQEHIEYYRKLLPIVYDKGYWRGEEVIKTPEGKEHHVITNISISVNVEHNKTHFICVYTDISAQKLAENELRIMANYDHLTGLPNRTLLLDRVNHAIATSHRVKSSIALFFIDLDRFKQINDSLGHKYGDLLLQEVSQRLSESMRGDDTLARIGGDEFIVLLEHFRGEKELGNIAQKFIDLIEQPFVLNDNVVSIGASIGISLCPDDALDAESLFRHADLAMYHAKQLGRNNYQFYTDHMNKAAKERLARETRLKLGLANNEFFNVYQPIIDAHTGKAKGVELLLRWKHENNIIPPIEFIELAEELGLIATMTEQAIERGFEQLIEWRKIRPEFYISVNFSAKHFIDKELCTLIKKQFRAYQLPTSSMKIEVTESALFSEPERAISTMNTLRDMGVLLSLDDFGTGFSSLSYLKQLPLDIIKIDRSFVSGIGIDKTDEAIVDATLVLAKSLNMFCIAEGVETKQQLEYLVARECHLIQGYLYYKPLSADEVFSKLNEDCDEMKAKAPRSDLL